MAERPESGPRGAGLGFALLGLGLAILSVVMAGDIGGSPALERLAFGLGLAWGPLLQGAGLVLALTGAWLVWRAQTR